MSRDTESRIREIEDREAIKELRHLYSYHVDQGKMAQCAALYSNDAVADFGPTLSRDLDTTAGGHERPGGTNADR